MAVLRIVLTQMVHTFAVAILAITLAMTDIPAMVLDLLYSCTALTAHWINTDIDECEEDVHLCNQTCNNTVGSYMCQCTDGYTLGIDGTSCIGKKY